MYCPMRRKDRELSEEQSWKILSAGHFGVLALCGENGCAVGLPLNYVLVGETLYFHGASAGAKMAAVRHHPNISFTVIAEQTTAWNEFDTFYTSVIASGTARVLDEGEEARRAMLALGRKFSPKLSDERIFAAVDQYKGRFSVIALRVEHLSGKRAVRAENSVMQEA